MSTLYILTETYGGTNDIPHTLEEVEEVAGAPVIELPDGRVVLDDDRDEVVAGALLAEQLIDGWSVVHEGARWWPDPEALEEIEASNDPEAAAIEIATRQPMRGTWHT